MKARRSALFGVPALALAALAWPLPERFEPSRGPAAELEPFEGSLAEARGLARDRNVPLFVLWIFEPEPWDPKDHHDIDGLRRALFSVPALGAGLERAVVLLGCNRLHPAEEIEVAAGAGKERRKRCSSFRTTSCSAHQRCFDELYSTFNAQGALRSPFVLVETPAGEFAQRVDDGSAPKISALVEALEQVRAKAGPGLSPAEHRRVLLEASRARAAVERRALGEAWSAHQAVLSIPQSTGYAEEARAGQQALLAAFDGERASAEQAIAGGQVVEGYRQLVDLSSRAQGMPGEKELAQALKKLEQVKTTRPAIEAYKRESAAQVLLGEIEALMRTGDERKAAPKMRGLLKRYGDTAAALTARLRWPQLASGRRWRRRRAGLPSRKRHKRGNASRTLSPPTSRSRRSSSLRRVSHTAIDSPRPPRTLPV